VLPRRQAMSLSYLIVIILVVLLVGALFFRR
jgi:hypothetical protein